jgi:hypothetical protein
LDTSGGQTEAGSTQVASAGGDLSGLMSNQGPGATLDELARALDTSVPGLLSAMNNPTGLGGPIADRDLLNPSGMAPTAAVNAGPGIGEDIFNANLARGPQPGGSTQDFNAMAMPPGLGGSIASLANALAARGALESQPGAAAAVDPFAGLQSARTDAVTGYPAAPGAAPDPFAGLQTARTDPLSATPYPGSPPAISALTDQDIQRILQMGGQTAPAYDPSRDIIPGAFTAPGTVTAQNLAPLSTPVGNVPTPLGRPDISATIPTAPAPGPAPASGTRPGAFTPGAGPGAGAPAPAAAPAPTPSAGPTDATARGGGVPLPSLAQLAALLGPGPGR